jgi:uncharacterized phage-associated protein
MEYSALEVARYVIDYCFKIGTPISNLKLQKMLYFIQGEFYKVKGMPLFSDDMAAWQFGPVVPSVYYEFCVYAGTPILNAYQTEICPEAKTIINSVIKDRKDMPVWQLVNETHAPGTPWFQVYNNQGNRSVIPKELVGEYFSTGIRCN